MKTRTPLSLAAAAFVVAALFLGGVAAAEDAECVELCKEDSGVSDCRFDAREVRSVCLEAAGCEALREVYIAACLGTDPIEAECVPARDGLRECVSPCREQFHSKMEACREVMTTCLQDVCGLEPGHGCKGPHGRGRNRP